METLKVVIFDFDGVLFDSWETNYKIIKFISKFSKYTEEEILKMWGMRGELFIKLITKKFPWPLNFLIRKFIYWTWRLTEMKKNSKAKFFDNALTICEKLKNNGCIVGILTNRISKTLKTTLKKLPNPPDYYFNFIQTCEFNKKNRKKIFNNHLFSLYPKPNPQNFVDLICNYLLREIEKRKVKYSNIKLIYVGDTLTDLEFVEKTNKELKLKDFKIEFYGILTGPLNTKEKWIKWSNNKIEEENILTSLSKLLEKLKIPQ